MWLLQKIKLNNIVWCGQNNNSSPKSKIAKYPKQDLAFKKRSSSFFLYPKRDSLFQIFFCLKNTILRYLIPNSFLLSSNEQRLQFLFCKLWLWVIYIFWLLFDANFRLVRGMLLMNTMVKSENWHWEPCVTVLCALQTRQWQSGSTLFCHQIRNSWWNYLLHILIR